MEGERISYHESVRRVVEERIRPDGMNNIWDRFEAQGMGGDPDKRCPYCMGGVRCDLCSNGPCRGDAEKDKRGSCGITADGMAMRMMLSASKAITAKTMSAWRTSPTVRLATSPRTASQATATTAIAVPAGHAVRAL